MTGYEKQSDAELSDTLSQWHQIKYSSDNKGAWLCIISILLGGGVFVAILPEGINLIYGVIAILAIAAFLKYKSMTKLSSKASEEIELITQEQKQRSLNSIFGDEADAKQVTHSHRSKYYPSNESWTNSPAWAFEIPLSEFYDSEETSVVELVCEPEFEEDECWNLHIPSEFLKDNFDSFYFREDRKKISLFLSAESPNRFREIRGKDEVDFSPFKKII